MPIKFNVQIKGLDDLDKKLKTIVQKIPNVVQEGIEDVLKNIQGYAIKLEKGHHQDGILVEMIDTKTNEIKGKVYTDLDKMPFALYEHFGTGRFAEMEHVGKSKHFLESGYTEWFIPVNKVTRNLNYPIINIKGQYFYVAHGSKANHFMTDAEFQSREENKKIVADKLNKMFEEACK